MNDAKPKTIFDERDQLQRDNERLLTAFENKTLECVGLRNQLEAARKEIANLEAQRNICLAVANSAEAARKVADAAVAYFEFFGIRKHVRLGGVLADAVREYRKLKEASNEQVKRTEANAD